MDENTFLVSLSMEETAKKIHSAVVDGSITGELLDHYVIQGQGEQYCICLLYTSNYLTRVTERTRIEKDGADARFTEDDGATWTHLSGNTIVSMNLWGFTESFLKEAEAR